jgi:hypothetical protein
MQAAATSQYRPLLRDTAPARPGGHPTARFSRAKPASARLGTHGPAAAAANNSPISPCPEIPVDRTMGELLVRRRAERPPPGPVTSMPNGPRSVALPPRASILRVRQGFVGNKR